MLKSYGITVLSAGAMCIAPLVLALAALGLNASEIPRAHAHLPSQPRHSGTIEGRRNGRKTRSGTETVLPTHPVA